MKSAEKRLVSRLQRKQRIRHKISGTAQRPRLAVFRSSQHIYAQAIDDEQGVTLVSASTVELKKGHNGSFGNAEAAKLIGRTIAERLQAQSISQVVFDRGGFLYHGRIRALAEAAREGGLKF